MPSVAVIDYGMGNLHSIAKALQYAVPNCYVQVTAEPKVLMDAERVVFPGVGAIRDCMQALNQTGLIEVIKHIARSKPFLGVCLGMQALLSDSEENNLTPCLNLIPGRVIRFPESLKDSQGNILKIPHMGWNRVHQHPHPLWDNIPQDSRFYFVHSYYAKPDETSAIAGLTDYPNEFASALSQDNLFAVQFHPEKSQTAGLQLLKNFLHWDGTL